MLVPPDPAGAAPLDPFSAERSAPLEALPASESPGSRSRSADRVPTILRRRTRRPPGADASATAMHVFDMHHPRRAPAMPILARSREARSARRIRSIPDRLATARPIGRPHARGTSLELARTPLDEAKRAREEQVALRKDALGQADAAGRVLVEEEGRAVAGRRTASDLPRNDGRRVAFVGRHAPVDDARDVAVGAFAALRRRARCRPACSRDRADRT